MSLLLLVFAVVAGAYYQLQAESMLTGKRASGHPPWLRLFHIGEL